VSDVQAWHRGVLTFVWQPANGCQVPGPGSDEVRPPVYHPDLIYLSNFRRLQRGPPEPQQEEPDSNSGKENEPEARPVTVSMRAPSPINTNAHLLSQKAITNRQTKRQKEV
jgi:hypothetical protein